MSTGPAAIEIANLHKTFGQHEVLKGIDLTAHEGDVVSIIGSSGSGKSTFLRCINLLEQPTEGKIAINGELLALKRSHTGDLDVVSQKQLVLMRERLGFVFQNFNLWPHMTILENIVEAPINVLKQKKKDAIENAEQLLHKVGMYERKDFYPAQLSGGQQQRVASMSITKERQRVVDFTDPYYSGGLRFVAGKVKDLETTREALKGKTIGAQRATVGGIYLEDNLSDVVTVKLYDNNDSVYLDLKAGRLDGALSDELPTHEWLKNEPGFEYKDEAFKKNDKIGIAVRKNDQKLRNQLNEALHAIVANGTYAEINAKYFPFPIY